MSKPKFQKGDKVVIIRGKRAIPPAEPSEAEVERVASGLFRETASQCPEFLQQIFLQNAFSSTRVCERLAWRNVRIDASEKAKCQSPL